MPRKPKTTPTPEQIVRESGKLRHASLDFLRVALIGLPTAILSRFNDNPYWKDRGDAWLLSDYFTITATLSLGALLVGVGLLCYSDEKQERLLRRYQSECAERRVG
jgi:hypothetical protein